MRYNLNTYQMSNGAYAGAFRSADRPSSWHTWRHRSANYSSWSQCNTYRSGAINAARRMPGTTVRYAPACSSYGKYYSYVNVDYFAPRAAISGDTVVAN